jgi:toxic protein SymE
MADLHSTPDTDETGTERSLIVGYRPKVHDKTTPNIILSGKWLRAAGFETGHQVTVKVMKGCIVLMAFSENEQKLLDDYKQTKEKLVQIENVLAGIQSEIPGKLLAKSVTNHQV